MMLTRRPAAAALPFLRRAAVATTSAWWAIYLAPAGEETERPPRSMNFAAAFWLLAPAARPNRRSISMPPDADDRKQEC